VWKVFKQGSSLQDLQKQWPHGMLEKVEQRFSYETCMRNGRLECLEMEKAAVLSKMLR
jgi:hypothetical protein